jgi:thiol-disulfide isomerase/thioredoxin
MNLGASLQHYSVIWVAAGLFLLVGILLFRNRPRLPEILAFGGIIVALIALYFYIRPTATTLMGEAEQVRASIGAGKPVLLEFQSPYCVGCVALVPTIDKIEAEYQDRLLVLRINIQDEVGMQLAPLFSFEYTPTFIFFDETGVERWRSIGSFDEERLRQFMKTP